MDAAANWAEFILSDDGPAIPLPRRSVPPRNAERYSSSEVPWKDNASIAANTDSWDQIDLLAVVGCVIALIGLLLALFPELRRGGILVPVGLALMAIAAYAARRKDETAS
jgi:hypothetical protein